MRNDLKPSCPHGHPYDEVNTYWYQGRRFCRMCKARYRTKASAAATKRWKAANPDRVLSSCALRRAKKRGATVERVSRAVVFARDGGLCGECGAAVDPLDWHLDHVVPLIVGGAHSYSNTRVTHPECNLSKGKKENRRG